MKTSLTLLNGTKKLNERCCLLKFLTPVMVVINYPTMMSVIVVIKKLYVISTLVA